MTWKGYKPNPTPWRILYDGEGHYMVKDANNKNVALFFNMLSAQIAVCGAHLLTQAVIPRPYNGPLSEVPQATAAVDVAYIPSAPDPPPHE